MSDWYNATSWGVIDYPEERPTYIDIYHKRHRDLDDDDYEEEDILDDDEEVEDED